MSALTLRLMLLLGFLAIQTVESVDEPLRTDASAGQQKNARRSKIQIEQAGITDSANSA